MMLRSTILLCCFIFSIHANSQTLTPLKASEALEIVINRDTLNAVLIDARSASMFTDGHIEGAINVDAFEDDAKVNLENYLQHSFIIVYCTHQRRAKLIIDYLKEFSYEGEIIFISDGISAWVDASYPTVGRSEKNLFVPEAIE